jgi:CheY-like chemotaxis protein
MANKLPILVVDDDEQDVFLLRRAFKMAGLDPWIIHVLDGEEALDYLRGQNNFKDRSYYPLPNLILLDIKMPKRDGFDVLQLLTRDEQKLHDMNRAYLLGAASFLLKPLSFKELYELGRLLPVRFLLPVNPPEIPPTAGPLGTS